MALSDYQALVARLVRDQSGQASSDDVTRVIGSAVQQYSSDAPQEIIEDVVWLAAGYFGPAAADMVATSVVLQAETPVGSVPPELVRMTMALSPGGLGLVAEEALAADQVVRVTYTAPHQLDATHDTIPLRHRDAVANLAASMLLRELATYYSGERETSIGADGSNTDSRARNYAARSRETRAVYFATLGVRDPIVTAASGGGAAALPGQAAAAVTSWPGRDRRWFRSNLGGA